MTWSEAYHIFKSWKAQDPAQFAVFDAWVRNTTWWEPQCSALLEAYRQEYP